MRTLSVRLDSQTDAVLAAFCARSGQTRSEAVKAGIRGLGEQSGTPAALAEKLGLIGCFDSGAKNRGRNHSRHLREKLARAR